ncbi:MAG: SusC/RagA family TonB-linked outer membrane protein, partial [Prolixibacteraceae bacterium]
MKKIGLLDACVQNFKKLMLIMKLSMLILVLSIATASAKTSYSQNTKFTLNLENVTVKELFDKIEKSSEFIFVYYDNIIDLNKEVSVKAENETVEEILESVFKSSENTYKVFDRQIVIAKKESSEADLAALLAEQQQKKLLKGKVTDEKGVALPGVSVVVKGTTVGITTDTDGNFNLSVPNDAKILVFSFVGMQTQEHPVGIKSTFKIVLTEQTTGLSEVVAIGYGTRTKKDITTAISTISTESINKSVSMSSELAMQGRMTGVQVASGGGNPMSRPTIRIRGVNTWGVSTPLYIVDGVPVTEFGAGIEGQEDARAADVRGPLNIMSMIDPNDIESISVLKDASAAAVYGVRAANGVVLITTKKGRGDRPVVEFSTRLGIQNITQKTDVMNTQQYTKYLNQVMASDPTIAMNTDNVGLFDATNSKYLGNSPTYNWQDAIKRPDAMLKDYSVRVSGGTAKTDYFVSVGTTKNEGAFRYNYLDRLSGSFKVNTQVNNWLKLGTNFRITSGKGMDFSPNLVNAGLYPAWQKIYDPNGLYGYASTVVGRKADGSYSTEKLYGNGTRVNELGNTMANDQTYKSMRNMGNIYVEIEPVKHLKIRGQM